MKLAVYRPVSGRIKVSGMRRPREDEPTNREWFKEETGKATSREWVDGSRGWDGYWTIAREHLMTVSRALAERFGEVEVDMDFNEHQRCDRRCQEAKCDDCTCSCVGLHHRGGVYLGWVEVGATTVTRSLGEKRSVVTLTRGL